MKRAMYSQATYLVLLITISWAGLLLFSQNSKEASTISKLVPGSCTIFSASYGNTVLYGNNEDYSNYNTYIWAKPSENGKYGGVYLGFDNFFAQGGVNEKGLAYDFNALPEIPLNPHLELLESDGIVKMMHETCATVEEAIAFAKKYRWGSSISWQINMADATGDAVVMSGGPNGELAFTRKQEGDGFLVSTNFNRANPENSWKGGYPCWRYNKAVEMLEKIKNEDDLMVEFFASILNAVHVESARGNTLYSNIFDLKNGIVYLYYWHQFDEVVKLDIANEIKKETKYFRIKDLFSKETVKKAADEHERYKSKR
jgi:hypothetical protein